MTLWQNSTMESFYGDGSEMDVGHCDVRIEGSIITVSYDDGLGGEIIYRGYEVGQGHYQLTTEDGNRATLHRFPNLVAGASDSKILEGWWNENGSAGMWRIVLGEDDSC